MDSYFHQKEFEISKSKKNKYSYDLLLYWYMGLSNFLVVQFKKNMINRFEILDRTIFLDQRWSKEHVKFYFTKDIYNIFTQKVQHA